MHITVHTRELVIGKKPLGRHDTSCEITERIKAFKMILSIRELII